MSTQRVLALAAGGNTTEIVPNIASAGAADSGKLVALNAAGQVDSTMMPAGIGADASTVLASAAISAGAMVNVYNNSGTLNARPADNTTPVAAVGFAQSAITSSASGTITYSGIVTGLTGLTPGATYYLGAAGAITATPTTTAGQILQVVGTALSATSLQFEPLAPITRA